jgi:hypothetical protein
MQIVYKGLYTDLTQTGLPALAVGGTSTYSVEEINNVNQSLLNGIEAAVQDLITMAGKPLNAASFTKLLTDAGMIQGNLVSEVVAVLETIVPLIGTKISPMTAVSVAMALYNDLKKA